MRYGCGILGKAGSSEGSFNEDGNAIVNLIPKPRIFKRGRYWWARGSGFMVHGINPEAAWRTWALFILFGGN